MIAHLGDEWKLIIWKPQERDMYECEVFVLWQPPVTFYYLRNNLKSSLLSRKCSFFLFWSSMLLMKIIWYVFNLMMNFKCLKIDNHSAAYMPYIWSDKNHQLLLSLNFQIVNKMHSIINTRMRYEDASKPASTINNFDDFVSYSANYFIYKFLLIFIRSKNK